jgi:hypothetical protein
LSCAEGFSALLKKAEKLKKPKKCSCFQYC